MISSVRFNSVPQNYNNSRQKVSFGNNYSKSIIYSTLQVKLRVLKRTRPVDKAHAQELDSAIRVIESQIKIIEDSCRANKTKG